MSVEPQNIRNNSIRENVSSNLDLEQNWNHRKIELIKSGTVAVLLFGTMGTLSHPYIAITLLAIAILIELVDLMNNLWALYIEKKTISAMPPQLSTVSSTAAVNGNLSAPSPESESKNTQHSSLLRSPTSSVKNITNNSPSSSILYETISSVCTMDNPQFNDLSAEDLYRSLGIAIGKGETKEIQALMDNPRFRDISKEHLCVIFHFAVKANQTGVVEVLMENPRFAEIEAEYYLGQPLPAFSS